MEFVSKTPTENESAIDYSLLGGEHAIRGHRLFLTGAVTVAASMVYLSYTAEVDDVMHLFQGLLIFALAFTPSLLWARTGGSRFPVFEMITVLCANAYGIPMIYARAQLADYSPAIITRAGWVVVAYLVAAILTYRGTTGIPGRSSFWREALITQQIERWMVYGMIFSTIYVTIYVYYSNIIPRDLESILRAVFFGLGILCSFVSAQRWGRGEMNQTEKMVFVCTLVPQLIIQSVSLILISAISQLGIALLGYLSGGKRVPWLVIVPTFLLIGVLHTGKSKMREKYWDPVNPAPPPTLTQTPAFYSEWITFGLNYSNKEKTVGRKLLERTSLMHMLCLIADYTPDRQDYLYGKTYMEVLPQLIPRFFWPDKPRSHIATYQLSIYYGLQDEEATNNTTIAFGLLAEAYANFGLVGAVLLGVFWGYVLKKCQVWSMFSPMFSFAGLFMILLTAWSFNAELTMAAWVSSFQQAVFVVLGVPLLLRGLLGSN